MRPFRTYLIGGGASGALLAGTLAAFLSVTTFVSRTTLPTGDAARDVATIQVRPPSVPTEVRPSLGLAPPPTLAPLPTSPGLPVLLASTGLPVSGEVSQGGGSNAAGKRQQGGGGPPSAVGSANGLSAKRSAGPAVDGDTQGLPSKHASPPSGHAKGASGLPPGLAKKAGGLPPGLAKKPPGLAKKAGLPPGLAKTGKVPPGHARKHR